MVVFKNIGQTTLLFSLQASMITWMFVMQNIYQEMNQKDYRITCGSIPRIDRFDDGLFRVRVQICGIFLVTIILQMSGDGNEKI